MTKYKYRPKTALFVTFFMICLTIGLILHINTPNNTTIPSDNEASPLTPMYSTNPLAPFELHDSTSYYEYYDYSTTNYYYNCSMFNGIYYLFWLYTCSSSDNFDLYLYSTSIYTGLLGFSNSSNQLDWIVYRSNSGAYRYPKSFTSTGIGDAYICCKGGPWPSINITYSVSLANTYGADLYEISLSSSTNYTVFLDVPSGVDFDLYVFRLSTGSCTQLDVHSSASNITGQYERIVFNPLYTDVYAIVITRSSGEGSADLTVYDYIYVPPSPPNHPGSIPTFELFPALLTLGAILFLYLTMSKKNNPLF